MVICRGGRPCPPSKFVEFSWLFVGADAHIGPLKCCDFASDFHKIGRFLRADRVVRPYGMKIETQCNNAHPPLHGGVSVLGWVDVGIDPYDVEYKFHECARRLQNRTISCAGNTVVAANIRRMKIDGTNGRRGDFSHDPRDFQHPL